MPTFPSPTSPSVFFSAKATAATEFLDSRSLIASKKADSWAQHFTISPYLSNADSFPKSRATQSNSRLTLSPKIKSPTRIISTPARNRDRSTSISSSQSSLKPRIASPDFQLKHDCDKKSPLSSPQAVSSLIQKLKDGSPIPLGQYREQGRNLDLILRPSKTNSRQKSYNFGPKQIKAVRPLSQQPFAENDERESGRKQRQQETETNHSSRKERMTSSDYQLIQIHLTQLTDLELLTEQVLYSLECLSNIAELNKEATKVLCDSGAVPIILAQLKRLPHNVEVFLRISGLLESMAREDDLVSNIVAKSKGLELLLGSMRALVFQNKTSGGALIVGNSIPNMRLGKSSRSLYPEEGVIGSKSSIEKLDLISRNSGNMPLLGLETHMQEDSIVEALLGKYREPKFMINLVEMDKRSLVETVRVFMNAFQKLDRIVSVTQYLGLDVNVEHVIARIVEQAGLLVNSESMFLTLVDPVTNELVPIDSQSNFSIKDLEKSLLRFPIGAGIIGWVTLHGIAMNVKNVFGNEFFDIDIDTRSGEVIAQSVLCVPTMSPNGQVNGVLHAVNKVLPDGTKSSFNSEDEFIMRALGRRLGIIINNVQMYQDMKQTQKKVEVLLETTKSLSSTLQLDELVRMIIDAAKELLNADRCTLFLIDKQNKQLVGHIQGANSIQEIRLPFNVGIAGACAQSGECINIGDAYKDHRFNPDVDRKTGYVTKTILCMPIKNIDGYTIGVIQMINKTIGTFTKNDIMILGSFSAQAAVAIEKSYLFKKTEDMRKYLQSILSSITNCVVTLSGAKKMITMNRPWFIDTLELTEAELTDNSIDTWIGEQNQIFLNDIKSVYETSKPVYSAGYELVGPRKSIFINYHIVSLMGGVDELSKGVVMVLEDISAEKRAINTLGRYMSPALVKQIMSEGGAQLGGVRKKISVLFSDIRSFTTLAESMQPHEVVKLLNSHFEDAVDAILAEQGILDKYIGDALMAVFGVPYDGPDDSIHACNAALRMVEVVNIGNARRVAQGTIAIKIGIGINTGDALSGNIGSTKRMEFSCIGDAVNLASRLEGLTKYYGVVILISEFTRKEVDHVFYCREVDKVMVMGKAKGVVLFELVQRRSEKLDERKERTLKLFAEGLSLYKDRRFEDAEKRFALAYELTNDGPSKTLAERCLTFMKHPPPEDWSGVWQAESK